MKQLILLRYSEIGLKSRPVRREFEKRLVRNIRSGLKVEGVGFSIKMGFGRIFLETEQVGKASEVLKRIFGLVSFSVCQATEAEIKKIRELALKIAKREIRKGQSFAVKTRRIGRHDFTSQDVSKRAGEAIVKNLGLRVNLSKPDKTIYIEVRDRKAYIYAEKTPSAGGMPLGTQGRVLSLVEGEGGLPSSWLMMKRGCETILLFVNVSDKTMKRYLNVLEGWHIGKKMRYYSLKSFSEGEIKGIIRSEGVDALALPVEDADVKQLTKMKKRFEIPIFTPLIGLTGKDIQNTRKKILYNWT